MSTDLDPTQLAICIFFKQNQGGYLLPGDKVW